MKEKQLIKDKIRQLKIEEFLAKEFKRAGYSHADIQRTPLAIRIVVFAQKPGMVIGRGGKTIDAITKVLKKDFGLENPQLDVQEIEQPDLDPFIVSKQIAAAIERGLNYRRVVNFTLQRVMGAGAVGIAVRVGGKIGGDIARTDKFSEGYLKYAGNTAEKYVKVAYATAKVKLGLVGIQVRIMTEPPKELELEKKIRGIVVPEVQEKDKEKVEERKEEVAEGEKKLEEVAAEVPSQPLEKPEPKAEAPKEEKEKPETKTEAKPEEKPEEKPEPKAEEKVEEPKEEPKPEVAEEKKE